VKRIWTYRKTDYVIMVVVVVMMMMIMIHVFCLYFTKVLIF